MQSTVAGKLSAEDAAAFLAAIVESSDDAIVGKALDGTVMTWNAGAERLFGWSAEEMVGGSIRRLVPADRQAEEDAIIASIAAGVKVPTFETLRRCKDGTLLSVAVTVSPVRDAAGRIVAASKILRDIRGAKRTRAALEASEQRFRMLADNISQLAWIADHTGWIFWYNQRWFDFTGTDLAAMQGWGWDKVHHPAHIDAVSVRWQQHLRDQTPWEDTFPMMGADGRYRWFLSRAVPVQDEAGRVAYWFGTNTDITEMRDAEQRIEHLMMEVNHRSKNMLAVIQALARRTAAQGGDFVSRLEARIQAIAANQDVLVRQSWSGVPVRDLVDAQTRLLGDVAQQVIRDGPDVLLSPGAAETIAMAIHEMATNAMKAGALSNRDGRVAIAWSVDGEHGQRTFTIRWTETGGPPVLTLGKRGFGSRIITELPRGKLGAEVAAEYPPEGFRWMLRSRLANVALPQPGDADRAPQSTLHPGRIVR